MSVARVRFGLDLQQQANGAGPHLGYPREMVHKKHMFKWTNFNYTFGEHNTEEH